MALYLGPQQIGECQRCGGKFPRIALTEDGYVRNLLVCPSCWDEDHPQRYPPLERPEGMPPLRPAPENEEFTPPVLIALLADGPAFGDSVIDVSWTEADAGPQLLDRYELYRSVDDGEFELVETYTIGYDAFRAVTFDPVREYADSDVTEDVSYSYYVIAYDYSGRQARSNTATVTFADVEQQATPPVLSLQTETGPNATAHLTWTESTITDGTIGQYELFRRDVSTDSVWGHFAYTNSVTLAYDDDTIEASHSYEYYVTAIPVSGLTSLDSNIVATGLIFVGIVITDMRFTGDYQDAAVPGIAYILGPNGPSIDGTRAFFPGFWGGGAERTDLLGPAYIDDIDITSDWTLEVTVEPRTNTPIGSFPTPVIFSIFTDPNITSSTFILSQTTETGPFRMEWTNGASTEGANGSTQGLILSDYDLVVTRTGNTMRLYVNGVLEATKAITAGIMVAGLYKFRIGFLGTIDPAIVQYRWRGWMDNIRFIQGQAIPP